MSKRGLIVGGTSDGIGKAFHQRSIEQGWDIVWDIPNLDLLDVTYEPGIASFFVNSAKIGLDGYDYIVYSAGVNELAWADSLWYERMEHTYRVNVFGFVAIMGHLRHLWPDKPVSAVAVVSDAARNPMRGSLAYCSSKAALSMAIRVMAREWAHENVRVNGVAPAVVADTPMSDYIDEIVPDFRGWSKQQAADYEQTMLPLKRRVTKEEVAHVIGDVLFGPEYMTGSIVDITGGK